MYCMSSVNDFCDVETSIERDVKKVGGSEG